MDALRPRVEDITQLLLDDLAATEPGTPVDLRGRLAFEWPIRVICEMHGVDDAAVHEQLAIDTALLLGSRTPGDDRFAAQAGLLAVRATRSDHLVS